MLWEHIDFFLFFFAHRYFLKNVWRKQDLSEISILFSFKENGPLNEKGKSNTSEEINPKD